MTFSRFSYLLPLLIVTLPYRADAITFVQFLNLFNIFVGFFLAATLLIFFGGLGAYISRLGTWPNHRDQALKVMEWAVAMLFVLIVLVAIVQAFERHTAAVMAVIAAIIILLIIYMAFHAFSQKEEEKRVDQEPR